MTKREITQMTGCPEDGTRENVSPRHPREAYKSPSDTHQAKVRKWTSPCIRGLRPEEPLSFQTFRRRGLPKRERGLWLKKVSSDSTATTRGMCLCRPYSEVSGRRNIKLRSPGKATSSRLDGASCSRAHVVENFQVLRVRDAVF